MALLTIFKTSFLVAKGLPIGVAIYRLCIYGNYSKASCIAVYGISCRQYN